MVQVTVHFPEELRQKIDKQRAENAAETGEVKSRSEWIRQASREKLNIDYTEEASNESSTEESKGAA